MGPIHYPMLWDARERGQRNEVAGFQGWPIALIWVALWYEGRQRAGEALRDRRRGADGPDENAGFLIS